MLIIGIAGGTGSGKTTVVRKIIESLPAGQTAVIPQDSYYWDSSHIPVEERQNINFDEPAAIDFDLLVKHLKELKAGHSIEQPIYSFLTCTRSNETITVEPRDIVIVEGILILCNEELRNMMDMKVFVDADADDRLIRVINRDIIERDAVADTRYGTLFGWSSNQNHAFRREDESCQEQPLSGSAFVQYHTGTIGNRLA